MTLVFIAFLNFAFLLLRFCKEEVSRSDGGDGFQFAVYWADTSVRPYGWVFLFAYSRFFNLPPLHSSLLGFKRDSFYLVFFKTPPLLQRGGGPLAVEEIVLNSRFFNLPPGFVGLTALLGGDKPPAVASNAPSRCPSSSKRESLFFIFNLLSRFAPAPLAT